jgi:hypothetical protein
MRYQVPQPSYSHRVWLTTMSGRRVQSYVNNGHTARHMSHWPCWSSDQSSMSRACCEGAGLCYYSRHSALQPIPPLQVTDLLSTWGDFTFSICLIMSRKCSFEAAFKGIHSATIHFDHLCLKMVCVEIFGLI